MPPATPVYAFGDFRLDSRARRLTRGGETIGLSEHQVDVLAYLLSHAGDVVSKDALIEAAWHGVAVTDNSLEQAISSLRKALGDRSRTPAVIQTVPRRGYRFAREVAREDPRASDAELEAMLAPYRAWVEGRAALETLERDAVLRAEQAFTGIVARSPEHASAHVGLANACVMRFEATRADALPDADALLRAGHHAREACRLAPQLAEPWATLALVHYRSGLGVQAIAAARRAVMLEPDNWRHHFRLAYVGWGEERLRAAQRTLALFPQFALARFLAATVYVARQAFDLAEQEAVAGASAQEAQRGAHAFTSVACHWLLGLVLLARGDEQGALASLERELACESAGQLFSRECAANSSYAIGVLMLRQGRRAEAAAAFERALQRVPAHLLAMIGLSIVRDSSAERERLHADITRRIRQLGEAGLVVEAATGRAAMLAATGGPEEAGPILEEALAAAPPGSGGWLIPIEPLLNVGARGQAFAPALARLRTRAA